MKSLGHLHGGNAVPYFERYGIPVRDVVDFSVNVSPLGPPARVRQLWPQLIESVAHYPSPDGSGIKTYYSQRYGVAPDNILSGNGSVELMYRVFGALSLKRVAVVTPSFFDYKNALMAAGTRCCDLNLTHTNGFATPSLEVLSAALSQCDGIVIGNPNNPTGTGYSRQLLLRLADMFPQKYLFADEAFLPFCESEPETTLLSEVYLRDNIIVFSSLTKLYAIPGLRAGCVVSSENIISMLSRQAPPWINNTLTDQVAALLPQCGEYVEQLRRLMQQEKARFKTAFGGIKEVTACFGIANFALVWVSADVDFDGLLTFLLRHGLFVRDCRNFDGIGGNAFRFCIRKMEENNLLISAIQRFFND